MIRSLLIAWLAILVAGCASQQAPDISQVAAPPASASSTPPVNPTSPPSPASGVELLGEISGSAPDAKVPSRPCKLDNCGVIVGIVHHRGAEKLNPGQALGAEGSGVYYGTEVGGEFTVTKIAELWQIRVRMRTGKVQVIQQDFPPLLEVGDRVLLDGGKLRLWF